MSPDDPTDPSAERDAALARVHGGLSVVARRGSARNRPAAGTLSHVDQTLLRMLADHPGARVVDIAEYFGFNRSTASRQTAALLDAGLIEEVPAGDDAVSRRGQPLRLSTRGRELLAAQAGAMRAVTDRRMREWTTADIERFADVLDRYNSGPEA
ncbi:MarR family winged helix-turn-helix transcriptional regulator [uncultured Microbacterium sp.]|uniref:MarR family winged helix-turn-helix transcriptional regulator n=1 Tax=uncultured Microbacterium sp. TaxID=191216 RepID=UPI0025F18351|nr:MarR family transcriptional regulator [uncultured Microbacterium sp.]